MSVIGTLAASFIIIVLAVAGMAVGVLAGRAPIKGSCGGVAGGSCDLCSGQGRCRKAENR
ncbi:MAG: ApbE family protein [Pseudomonadota bacterium]